MKNEILTKINDNSATIGIIGLGYVGLPLVIRFVEENFEVIGFDIDSAKCNSLNSGKSYIRHISAESIQFALKNEFIANVIPKNEANPFPPRRFVSQIGNICPSRIMEALKIIRFELIM